MKNSGFRKKIKLSQNFSTGKTYFLEGIQINKTWKSHIVYLFMKFLVFQLWKIEKK